MRRLAGRRTLYSLGIHLVGDAIAIASCPAALWQGFFTPSGVAVRGTDPVAFFGMPLGCYPLPLSVINSAHALIF